MLNVGARERRIVVFLEEVEDRDGEQLCDYTNVVAIVEPVYKMDAVTAHEAMKSELED